MKAPAHTELFELVAKTPEGDFLATYSIKGLCALNFPSRTRTAVPRNSAEAPVEIRQWHQLTTQALLLALSGQPPRRLPPLDLSAGTDFQRSVWEALRKIACGRTLSYAQVAEEIGNPKAVRAVGGACGANPIPVFVPCHRVLAAKQQLGGFSAGLDWKRKLLAIERVTLFE